MYFVAGNGVTVLDVCMYMFVYGSRLSAVGNCIIIAMSKYYWLAESKYRRRFINPEAISSHLRCSICQDVF